MTLLRQKFINRMIVRNMASGTQKLYLHAVVGLAKHYKCSPDTLLPQHVQDYLLFLIQERKLAWSTVRSLVHGLKFFYHDFLDRPRESYYIPSPKVPQKLPTVWSPLQIRAFLDAAKGLPLQTMIKVAYGSGLRANEVVHLRVPDIDSGHMTLWVRQGKRRKDRAALLTPTLLQDLRVYWMKYRPETWLFPSKIKQGNPIQAGSFGKLFGRLKELTGVADRPGRIHTLRHSFATHLVAAGADVYTVSKLLGHRKITTSMVYVHLAEGLVLKGARHLDLLTNQAFHV